MYHELYKFVNYEIFVVDEPLVLGVNNAGMVLAGTNGGKVYRKVKKNSKTKQ